MDIAHQVIQIEQNSEELTSKENERLEIDNNKIIQPNKKTPKKAKLKGMLIHLIIIFISILIKKGNNTEPIETTVLQPPNQNTIDKGVTEQPYSRATTRETRATKGMKDFIAKEKSQK